MAGAAAANPFDQFGFDNGAPPAQSGDSGVTIKPVAPPPGALSSVSPGATDQTSAASNPFDKFGFDNGSAAAPANDNSGADKSQPSGWSGIGQNFGAGVNEATIKTAGAPVDLANWALGHIEDLPAQTGATINRLKQDFTGGTPQAPQPSAPLAQAPLGGSDWLKQQQQKYEGINPDAVVPQTEAERVARGAGEGLASAVLPAGEVGAAERIGGLASPALEAARSVTGGIDATNAAIGTAAGAGGQAAADAAPDQWKPLAGVVGGLAAGGVPVAGTAAAVGLKAVGQHILGAVPPLTAAGREAAARATVGTEMANAASDRGAAVQNLENGPQEIVPGSVGTTAQIAGDQGLMGWEKGVAQTPEGRAALEQRATEQNNARQASLNSLQPTGNTLDLPAAIRQNQADTAAAADANTQLADTVSAGRVAAAQQAQDAAVQGLRDLKPDADPADVAAQFRAARDALDQHTQASLDQATAGATAARTAAAPQAVNAETLGANLREPLATANAAAKTDERALWKAVDPTGQMVLPAAPISDAAKSITGEMTASATPMSGEEQRIFDVASKYGDQVPFRDVTDLRSSISTEMRQARISGNDASLRRLTMLRGSVENAIDHAVENQAALDQIAIRRGTMAPQDSTVARLQKEANDFVAARRAAARTGSTAGDGNSGAVRAPDVSPTPGAEVPPVGGPQNSAGNQGIQGSAGAVDVDAAARLKAASEATKNRRATFNQGNVGKILDQGQSAGTFKRSDAQVPAQVFHKGSTAGEDMRTYLRAGGSVDHAIDAAAMSLRDAASKPDGTFDSKKTFQWMQDHKAALAELPQAARDKFLTTLSSQQAVEDAFASRRDILSDFEKSEAGKVAGLAHSSDIVDHVGKILDGSSASAGRLEELAKAAKGDPSAEAGLKRAVVEHVIGKFVPEVGDPRVERLQAYVADKRPVLEKVLSPQEIDAIGAKANQAAEASRNLSAAQAARKETMAQAEADKAARLSPYERGVLRDLIDAKSTADILDHLKGIFNAKGGAARMEKLATEAAKVEGGSDALKRGVQELLQREFSSNTAAGATHVMQMRRDAFAEFIKDKGDALRAAGLDDEQIKRLQDIVDDGLRANRSISMTKARGGSDTEANRQAAGTLAGHGSILQRLAHEGAGFAMEGLGAMAGGHHAGLPGLILGGAAGWLGKTVVGHLREAGLNRIKELRVQAALDPDLGKALLMAAPSKPDTNSGAILGLRARQLGLAAALSGARQ